MKIITRQEAKSAGLTRYFTGKPCPHGHVVERIVASKDCHACYLGRLKSAYRKNPRKYRDAALKWRKEHPERARAMACKASLKWSHANPEQAKATLAGWRKNNPERQREHNIRWMKANPDSIRMRTIRWRKNNPDKHRVNWTRRRAWKRGAEGTFTHKDIERLRIKQSDLCLGCSSDISRSYTIDHMVPLSRGGSNWPNNLQLLCASCNSSKQNKTMDEWLPTTTAKRP